MDNLKAVLDSLARLWPDDPSTPGLVLSYIPDRGEYYVSAVRYRERMGGGKYVVWSGYGADLARLVDAMAATVCPMELT